jgi:hypothetical protein
MRQLGMLEGSNILGDEAPGNKRMADPFRTGEGFLKAKSLRAINWYVEQHDLTLKAIAVYPTFYFGTSDGQEQGVDIEEIVSDYMDRDRYRGA